LVKVGVPLSSPLLRRLKGSKSRSSVTTLLREECKDETHTPEMGTWESSGAPESSEFDCKSQNSLPWRVFYIIGKLLSLDVQNGLAWPIWTSATQVMAKRKVGSQTGSLTPDH
jgi:hypothetical protein